jgi:PHD/YefM family antitoxin component YafN of YafNO toxin-antitoxin module
MNLVRAMQIGAIMNKVMPTMSLSDFRKHQLETLAALKTDPVVLTQNGRDSAVLVLPAQWNQLIDRLADLEDLIAALEMELAIERGDVEVETITDPDAFRREMLHGDKVPA